MRTFLYISWMNHLGGFDYWLFTGWKDNNVDVIDTGEARQNVFAGWPKSYGYYADTVNRQTFRRTKKSVVVRSQVLTQRQGEQMGEAIKSSILVQLVDSRKTRRTIIVDNQSIVVRRDANKMYTLSFVATYTDDYPIQHA